MNSSFCIFSLELAISRLSHLLPSFYVMFSAMAEHQKCLLSQNKAYELVIPYVCNILYTQTETVVDLYQQ